jgi:hypothetical protein
MRGVSAQELTLNLPNMTLGYSVINKTTIIFNEQRTIN